MTSIEQLFSPKSTDKEYIQNKRLKISLIARMDSYKYTHPYAYPDADEIGGKIIGMSSYGTARIPFTEKYVPFGLQILIKDKLTEQITMEDVDAAEIFAQKHFGHKLFYRPSWEKVVQIYNGYLPLVIRVTPEGKVINGGLPAYTISAFGEDFFWMSAAFETLLQRGQWYPSTVATLNYEFYQKLKKVYENFDCDMNLLPFVLHDFSARGVTCGEQAQIGTTAHLASGFMGSDSIEGILTANFYYNHDMAGFSIYATEHSVQCSYGKDRKNQINYIRHQLRKAKKLGIKIISIVIDGYDVYREVYSCCTALHDEIIEFDGKVVFRPDSGDMMITVPSIIQAQIEAFGYTTNKKGLIKPKYVGVIQGDGVDRNSAINLLMKLVAFGIAPDAVIFGSGGALLQKLNRDTLKYAQKASAILVRYSDGTEKWIGIAKDPVTDHGKKSSEGVLTIIENETTQELALHDLTTEIPNDWKDIMILVYHYGRLFNETTLDEVRKRIHS